MKTEILEKWIKTTKFVEPEEVKELIKYYESILKSLVVCPELYLLVKFDVRKQLDRLRDIDSAFKEQTK